MKITVELDYETGQKLEALAEKGFRSRRAQATKSLTERIAEEYEEMKRREENGDRIPASN